MNEPKVSIIIPVYNGSNYLREAIESALAQTYSNCEVIVVNDGSKDRGATDKIAKSFGRKIRYFTKENGGVATALNFGIKKMKGEYFSWLSHDDLYFPDKVESQINYIKKNHLSAKTILYGNFALVDSDGKQFRVSALKPVKTGLIGAVMADNFLSGCSLLVPKIAFLKAGYFDKNWWSTQDYQLWFRFIKAGFRFEISPGVLIKSRQHDKQDSRTLGDSHTIEKEKLYLWIFDNFSAKQIFGNRKKYQADYLFLAAGLEFEGYRKAAQRAEEIALKKVGSKRIFYLAVYRYFLPFVFYWFKFFISIPRFIKRKFSRLIYLISRKYS